MRVSMFTKLIFEKDKTFLFNSKTGAIDEVEKELSYKIIDLKRKGSFTSLDCYLDESLIENMVERGYITFYSDIEENDEKRWLMERFREKAKKEKKTISVIIDSFVSDNWCFHTTSSTNSAMNKKEINNMFEAISISKFSDEIDLWLILESRKAEFEWIVKQACKYGLAIRSLYTIIKNNAELEEIKNLVKNRITSPFELYIKYKQDKFCFSSIQERSAKTIVDELDRHPFFCPFIYKTFFIGKNGNISYCAKENLNYEKKFQYGVIGNLSKSRKNHFNSGWSEELFSAFCLSSPNCLYSIYCTKMCPYLGSIYLNENKDKCSLFEIFENLLKKKIRSMM